MRYDIYIYVIRQLKVNMDLKEEGQEGVEWINLAEIGTIVWI